MFLPFLQLYVVTAQTVMVESVRQMAPALFQRSKIRWGWKGPCGTASTLTEWLPPSTVKVRKVTSTFSAAMKITATVLT